MGNLMDSNKAFNIEHVDSCREFDYFYGEFDWLPWGI